MKKLKRIVIVALVLLVAWPVVNLIRGNDLFANPFRQQTVLEKLQNRGEDLLEEGADILEDGKDAAEETLKEGLDNVADKLKDLAD